MTGDETRERFLQYFKRNGHRRVKSDSLVPAGDPTLMFTNAGMVQFKNVFTGEEKRGYTRAASSQKCLRVSGKHNDLEQVGYTARHHTFFEMLGNFSFGDYFKEEAIRFGWEFLVDVMGLPADRLWVSIYQDDDEAHKIWREQVGVPEARILRRGEKDNYWAMGDTGPCGPCSEIILEQSPAAGPSATAPTDEDLDSDRFLEIWNLVFMQFDQSADGKRTPLPKPCIDTGMGLERLASVVQGESSNFHTDLLFPIIRFTEELTETRYDLEGDFYSRANMSFRVIADHARAIAFLVGDGILPSNEGRGYVLRRILRRAARHGQLLGIGKPFLYQAVGTVAAIMKKAYPELHDSLTYISRVTLAEEERFAHTLNQGLPILADLIASAKERKDGVIDGKAVFQLYDTHGFPVDLIEDAAVEEGLSIDRAAFEAAMEGQRERARASWKGFAETGATPAHLALANEFAESEFVGYARLTVTGKVLAILRDGQRVDEAAEGDRVEVVLDQTSFYAEAGGQIGDRGVLENQELRFEVQDSQAPVPGYRLHIGVVRRGTLRVGDEVQARVDAERRTPTQLNHTATHLLHAALREVLGDHVKQAGSLVAPDRLRFDYTHFSAVTPRERGRIEEIVNRHIRQNAPVRWEELPIEEAMALGAMALFGEKYGETVRMVTVNAISKELCGGTHVSASGEIGLFKIVHEGSVGAGVRRIEAVTGPGALAYVRKEEEELARIGELLKASPLQAAEKVERLLEEQKDLERETRALRQRLSRGETEDMMSKAREIGGVRVLVARVEEPDPRNLRDLVDAFKGKLKSGIVVLGTEADGKAALASGVTKDLTKRFHAGEILREAAQAVGGKGGGRPDMAQAGGKDAAKLDAALERAVQVIERAAGDQES
ncbi:MAG: alanine--tRNA ligase [Nitrospinota bacterium]